MAIARICELNSWKRVDKRKSQAPDSGRQLHRNRMLLTSIMASSESSQLTLVKLVTHPTARSKAISTTYLAPGSTVVSVPSLSTVLLPDQKGQRCDACLRLKSDNVQLRACSGCHGYWYCGQQCASPFVSQIVKYLNINLNTLV